MATLTMGRIIEKENPRFYKEINVLGKYIKGASIESKDDYEILKKFAALGFLKFSKRINGMPSAKLTETGQRHYNTLK